MWISNEFVGKNGKLYEYEVEEFWNMDNVDLNEILIRGWWLLWNVALNKEIRDLKWDNVDTISNLWKK